MSSQPDTVISRRWTSSSSTVGVSKASAFRFISRAVCSHNWLNLRQPIFSSCRRSDLEQSSAARHICAVTFHLLHSLEDVLLRILLFIIPLSCLQSDIVILDTWIVFIYVMYADAPLLYVHVGLPVQPTKAAWWPWPWPWKWCSSHVWRWLPLCQFWSS